MRRLRLSARKVYWVTAGVMLAAIVHIAFVFASPLMARDTAWQRLNGMLPVNAMKPLPPATPDAQVLPYMSPDVRYAVCRFDLAPGPLMIRARLLDGPWSVTLYTPGGENFFAMTSADLPKSEFELTLTPPVQRSLADTFQAMFARPLRAAREQREVALSVASPTQEGLAMLRAPLMGVAFERETEAALAAASCAPQRRLR